MFDIGSPELIFILLAVIVLFGPKNLPDVATKIGKGMQKIRKAQAQMNAQFNNIKQEIEKSAENEKKAFEKAFEDNFENLPSDQKAVSQSPATTRSEELESKVDKSHQINTNELDNDKNL